MAKTIHFQLDNIKIQGELGSPLTRKALYGYAKKIQHQGDVLLERRYVTPDGQVLYPTEVKSTKVDSQGTIAESPLPMRNGKVVELKASSFDEPRSLKAGSMEDMLNLVEVSTYPVVLTGTIPAGLYTTEFTYRASVDTAPAILDVRSEGPAFLRIGKNQAPVFVGPDTFLSVFEEDTEEVSEEIEFGF